MARYQVILAYDGSAFKGSQRQAQSRTVQGELEKALHKLGWHGSSVLMAGRTDTGVHASGQVAAFDLDWSHTDDQLIRALNAGLPEDLAVQAAHVAAEDFHPRFDARSRRYAYRLFFHRTRHPLRERLAWRVWPPLELGLLQEAARLFVGTHDFAAFGSATSRHGSTVRTVHSAGWSRSQDECRYEVQADAFLYRMVRRLVYVQVAAAQGRCTLELLDASLQQPAVWAVQLPAGLAPAQGLTLVEVTY
jgi:tRNA pseudouridine38-40 synthase